MDGVACCLRDVRWSRCYEILNEDGNVVVLSKYSRFCFDVWQSPGLYGSS